MKNVLLTAGGMLGATVVAYQVALHLRGEVPHLVPSEIGIKARGRVITVEPKPHRFAISVQGGKQLLCLKVRLAVTMPGLTPDESATEEMPYWVILGAAEKLEPGTEVVLVLCGLHSGHYTPIADVSPNGN